MESFQRVKRRFVFYRIVANRPSGNKGTQFSSIESDLHNSNQLLGHITTLAAYICGSEGTGSVRVRSLSGDSLRLFIYLSTFHRSRANLTLTSSNFHNFL
jgi:hypothetical protein